MQSNGGSTAVHGSMSSLRPHGSLRKKGFLWYRRSLRGTGDRQNQNSGTLPRTWRQSKQKLSKSLVNYSDPQRTAVVLDKQDNETYGFEIQTYGLQPRSSAGLELYTFVCRVHEASPAESAGLTTGDVIITINGVSIEGSSHQEVVNLIKDSPNQLRMETVCSSIVKRIELDKKMSALKQTLKERWVELQALTLQENRLLGGNLNDLCPASGLGSLLSLDSSAGRRAGRRFSSDSSYVSHGTESSDQASVFGDLGSPSPLSSSSITDDAIFFTRDFQSHSSASRTSSGPSPGPRVHHACSVSSDGSMGSLSPSWDEARVSSLFGTLPRKARGGSVRRHLLKFIPRFNQSVEEEELGGVPAGQQGAAEAV